MPNNTKVSVIIPIYKVEAFLETCLDSLLAQTLQEMEVILVDDGSPDSSPAICDKYAKLDARIRVFHTENRGYGAACNFGISEANGEYIAIVEPDDFIDKEMMELMYASAKESDVDIVKSSYWEYKDLPKRKRNVLRDFDVEEGRVFTIDQAPIILTCHPSIWSCIYRRKFLLENDVKFPKTYRAWEDNPFQVAAFCSAKSIKYINAPHYHWRKNYIYDCEKISNPKIPFLRTFEIHDWLAEHKVTCPDIYACLRIRELVYLKLLYQAAKFSDLKELSKLNSKYINLPTHKISKSSQYYEASERYYIAKISPVLFFLYCKFKLYANKALEIFKR